MVIMRGIPGSGKSTTIQQKYPNHYVCSADFFFEKLADQNDTSYIEEFKPWLLSQAHASCLREFILMLDGVNDLVVDNTNSQKWEYANYVLLAQMAGYDVFIEEMPCNGVSDVRRFHQRQTHGVPWEAMEAMFNRWETDERFTR
jgi:predicted kinase